MERIDTCLQAGLLRLSNLTFGRDYTHFKQLIALLTIVSIVLWSAVLATTFLRSTSHLILYRSHRRYLRTKIKEDNTDRSAG